MKPRVCDDQLKVIIPIDTEECEFWLSLVKSIDDVENPDRDHAWITSDNVFYVYNGKKFVSINDPNTLKVKWGNVFGDIADQTDLYEILSKTIWTVKENGTALDFDYLNHEVDVNVPIMTVKLNGNKLEPSNYEVNIDLSDYALASTVPTKLSELSNDTNYITQEQVVDQIKVKSISLNTEPQTVDEFGNVDLTVSKIKSISVNKEAQTIDDDGNVNLTISGSGGTTSLEKLKIRTQEKEGGLYPIQELVSYDGTSATDALLVGGDHISLVNTDDTLTIEASFDDATSSSRGLMSATDKAKLDALPNFYSGTDSEPSGTFTEGDIYFQLES